MTHSPDTDQAAFAAETAAFRKVIARGRSANQLALFDLLVERSYDQRSPKELEIALLLFGNDVMEDANADSGVRVYVHRLRKRMEEHYRGKDSGRLIIPKGEYRIVLETSLDRTQPPRSTAWLTRLRNVVPRPHSALAVGLSLLAAAALGLGAWLWRDGWDMHTIPDGDSQALLAAAGLQGDPLIVIGDSMLLAETEDQRSIQRMVLNPAIRTRDDFGLFLRQNPDRFYQLYDFGLNFAPISSVEAAWNVQGSMPSRPASSAAARPVVPVSALTSDEAAARDLIFVGRLSQLGRLAPQVAAESRFRLAAYDRLVDAETGTTYVGQVYSADQAAARLDYGYLAVRSGPEGHAMVVVAGVGDQGTAAIVSLLDSPEELAEIRRRAGGSHRFEALVEVTPGSGAPTRRRLVAAYPLP